MGGGAGEEGAAAGADMRPGAAVRALGSIPPGAGSALVDRVASALGDGDIEVRGEAFRLLVASRADIGRHIAPLLASPSSTVRAHSALVLANRGDAPLAGEVARLARDESAAVRSSAMGALGHMALRSAPRPLHCAPAAAEAVRSCLGDGSIEVRRSALQAAVHIGMELDAAEEAALQAAADAEIDRLLALYSAGRRHRRGGGGGNRGDGDNDSGGPGGN